MQLSVDFSMLVMTMLMYLALAEWIYYAAAAELVIVVVYFIL